MPLVFVLNPGRTRCVIDTLSYASGEENVKLHNYYLNKRIIENKINSLSEEYNYYVLTNKLNDSLDLDFKAELGFLNRQSNELDYNFIYANNDNNAGAFIFLQSYSVLSKQQILDILTTATDNFKSLPEIEIISNQFYSENQSSVGMPYINAYLLDSLNQKIPISYYVNKNFWVLLNFWRSDCQPCVDELPYLKEIYENYAPRGLIILGISLDKSSSLWLYTLDHDNALWPQFCDFKGWDSDIVKKYGVYLLPFNLLINPAGTIVLRGDRQGALSQKLKEIFQE
jgi:AhpC/TSA family.